jgi:hypothetical protein
MAPSLDKTALAAGNRRAHHDKGAGKQTRRVDSESLSGLERFFCLFVEIQRKMKY